MKKTNRDKLLQALDALGRKFPQWRFGQLVENVAGWADVDTWDVEDDNLLAAAKNYLASPSDAKKPRKTRSQA